jgi:hypothetical protein
MTTSSTLPGSRPALPLAPHEHAWLIESRHPTSDGIVLYVRCATCATRRVDLQRHPQMPPAAISAELHARSE